MERKAESTSILLICIGGPDMGKRIAVSERTAQVGRSSACDVASDDPEVSAEHLTLQVEAGKLTFSASANSVAFVDGQRQTKGVLAPGQQLRIGRSLWQIQNPSGVAAGDIYSFVGGLGDRISELAGVEKIEGFKLSEMLSEIWRSRTDEDMENYFAVGTPCNTPKLADVETTWPKPWFFFKTFTLAALVYAGFLFAYCPA
jgi:hypothetical protein